MPHCIPPVVPTPVITWEDINESLNNDTHIPAEAEEEATSEGAAPWCNMEEPRPVEDPHRQQQLHLVAEAHTTVRHLVEEANNHHHQHQQRPLQAPPDASLQLPDEQQQRHLGESPPEVTRPIIGNGDVGNNSSGRGGQQYLRLTQEDINAITEAGSKGGTFTCTLCQKKFGYKNGLIRHVRLTHVGEKPYQCNICQRRFGYKHILMEHQNLHFGNRPYACTLCDKRFAARSNLIQHRMVHKRPFNCSLCNKRFDREDQLKKHLFAHPQALLTCNFCTYAAAAQSDLNKHMVEHHPPQVMETRAPPTRRESGENGEGPEEDSAGEDGGRSSTEQPNQELTSPILTPQPLTTQPLSSPLTPTSTAAAVAAQNALNYALRVTNEQGGRGQRVESICNQLSSLSGTPVSAANPGALHHQQGAPPEVPIQGVIVKKEAEDMDSCSVGSSEQPLPSPRTPVSHNHTDPPYPHPQQYPMSASESPRTPSFFSSQSSMPLSSHSDFSRSTPIYTSVPASCMNSNMNCLSQGKDSKPHTLPGIHEVFSRRNQRVPPTFTSFGLPTLLSDPARLPLPPHADLPLSLLSPPACPPNSFTSSLPVTPSITTPSSGISTRPMAQLPPITQVLRPSKDVAVQHTAPIPGFPSLDDVLSYYQGQGRLFRCQHCNILFFERGMYFLHASLHGPSSPWECSICHKVCSDKNEFTLHFVNQQHNSV